MKKYFFIIGLIAITLRSNSQSRTKYFIPDSVEILLDKQVKEFTKKKKGTVYFLLGSDSVNTYYLSLFKDESKQKDDLTFKLVQSSTRYLTINSKEYPLIFDYDFVFSSPKENQIGEFGKREGTVVRSHILFHGYTLYFNMRGQILKVSTY